MLKKRLVGVITVKNGWAVQSFGYARHLPLGRPECIAENFDRWGADEILILNIDRTRREQGPDFELLKRLGRLGLSTPLSYGGGIRDSVDARAVVQTGAERVCLDALLSNEAEVRNISALVGAQAVIAAMPVAFDGQSIVVRDYRSKRDTQLSVALQALFASRVVSEALLIDWQHEGVTNAFDTRLVDHFPWPETPLIVFGGISEPKQLDRLFANHRVVAAGVGNFLAYREHAVQLLKRQLHTDSLRSAAFQNNY